MGKKQQDELVGSLKELYHDRSYADLEIICGPKRFRVHKAMVYPRSNLRDTASTPSFDKTAIETIDLSEYAPSTAAMMIHYFYNLDYLKEEKVLESNEMIWPSSPPDSPILDRDDQELFSTRVNEPTESVTSPEPQTEETAEEPEAEAEPEPEPEAEATPVPPEPTDDEAPGLSPLDQDASLFQTRLESYKEKKCRKCARKGRKCRHVTAASKANLESAPSQEQEQRPVEPEEPVQEPEPKEPEQKEPEPEEPAEDTQLEQEPPSDREAHMDSDIGLVPTLDEATLMAHINVYILARAFWIPGLEYLALERFKGQSEKQWDSLDFLEAASEAYSYAERTKAQQNNPLKQAVILAVYKNPSVLDKSELREYMRGHDLWYDMVCLIRDNGGQIGDQNWLQNWHRA